MDLYNIFPKAKYDLYFHIKTEGTEKKNYSFTHSYVTDAAASFYFLPTEYNKVVSAFLS